MEIEFMTEVELDNAKPKKTRKKPSIEQLLEKAEMRIQERIHELIALSKNMATEGLEKNDKKLDEILQDLCVIEYSLCEQNPAFKTLFDEWKKIKGIDNGNSGISEPTGSQDKTENGRV